MKKANKGLIKITNELINQDWTTIYVLFEYFRPTYIEFRYWENDIWYFYGVSELFDELKEGENVPHYDVIFTNNKDQKSTIQFKRINQ